MGLFDKFRKSKDDDKKATAGAGQARKPCLPGGRQESHAYQEAGKKAKRDEGKISRTKEKERVKKEPLKSKKKPVRSEKSAVKKFDNVQDVLVKPIVTEKSSNLGMYNQYAFRVSDGTNKVQIKKAIETYYNVKPVKVNIINIKGKQVRWGRTRGRTRGWKKAMVTLRQGDKIELYEGV